MRFTYFSVQPKNIKSPSVNSINFNHNVIKIILFHHSKPFKMILPLSYEATFHAFGFLSSLHLIPYTGLPFSKVRMSVCIFVSKLSYINSSLNLCTLYAVVPT